MWYLLLGLGKHFLRTWLLKQLYSFVSIVLCLCVYIVHVHKCFVYD